MARLNLVAEAVYGINPEARTSESQTPFLAVSVTREDGRPVKGLKTKALTICAICPPHVGPKFKKATIASLDEQKAGLYVIAVNVTKALLPPSGKYIFSVTISSGADRGETLTTLVI